MLTGDLLLLALVLQALAACQVYQVEHSDVVSLSDVYPKDSVRPGGTTI